jgi:hypothetical protein
MSIRDNRMDWLRKHVFVGGDSIMQPKATITLNEATPNTLLLFTPLGGGAGTPDFTEVSTFDIAVPELDGAGDEVAKILLLPFDMDPSFSLKFRIHYCGKSTTAADTYTWKGWYNNAKSAAALAAASVAMSPDFGATNVLSGTAYQAGRTGWAEIAADTWTRAEIEAGHILPVKFELDASDATLGSEEVYFLGFEYSYVPQFTKGNGSRADFDSAS